MAPYLSLRLAGSSSNLAHISVHISEHICAVFRLSCLPLLFYETTSSSAPSSRASEKEHQKENPSLFLAVFDLILPIIARILSISAFRAFTWSSFIFFTTSDSTNLGGHTNIHTHTNTHTNTHTCKQAFARPRSTHVHKHTHNHTQATTLTNSDQLPNGDIFDIDRYNNTYIHIIYLSFLHRHPVLIFVVACW